MKIVLIVPPYNVIIERSINDIGFLRGRKQVPLWRFFYEIKKTMGHGR